MNIRKICVTIVLLCLLAGCGSQIEPVTATGSITAVVSTTQRTSTATSTTTSTPATTTKTSSKVTVPTTPLGPPPTDLRPPTSDMRTLSNQLLALFLDMDAEKIDHDLARLILQGKQGQTGGSVRCDSLGNIKFSGDDANGKAIIWCHSARKFYVSEAAMAQQAKADDLRAASFILKAAADYRLSMNGNMTLDEVVLATTAGSMADNLACTQHKISPTQAKALAYAFNTEAFTVRFKC